MCCRHAAVSPLYFVHVPCNYRTIRAQPPSALVHLRRLTSTVTLSRPRFASPSFSWLSLVVSVGSKSLRSRALFLSVSSRSLCSHIPRQHRSKSTKQSKSLNPTSTSTSFFPLCKDNSKFPMKIILLFLYTENYESSCSKHTFFLY